MMKRVLSNGVKLFLVDDVSPEDMAMLMALYARSPASVEVQVEKVYEARRVALNDAQFTAALAAQGEGPPPSDEPLPSYGTVRRALFEATMQVVSDNHPTARAVKLHDRYVAGYGHKSIADCGSTALFIEGGSMLLAKAIEDTPLYNGQEMSSRAVDCGALTYVDPIGTPESAAILEAWRAFYKQALPIAAEEIKLRYPRLVGEDEAQYMRAVKMRAFDVCRGFLPFGCSTQVGWAGTLRHVGDRLAALSEHPAQEVRDAAEGLLSMCRERYPSSSFEAAPTITGEGKLTESEAAREARRLWSALAAWKYTYAPEAPLFNVLHDSVLAASNYHMGKLSDPTVSELLRSRPRGALLPHSMASFGLMHFEFPLDMGSWRDIQRHRALVCRPALLTADHGFEPWYLDQLPKDLHDEALLFVANQARAVTRLTSDPVLRQYYLGMGFRVHTRISAGLPALVYMLELRSGKAIHPTLRRRVLEMADHLQFAHPDVALHVDRDQDDWTVRRGSHVITEIAPTTPDRSAS